MTTNTMMTAAHSAVRRNVTRKVSPMANPRSSSLSLSSQSSLSIGTFVALGKTVVIGPSCWGTLVSTGGELGTGFTTVITGSGSDGRVNEGAGEEEGEGEGTGDGEGEGGVASTMKICVTVFSFMSLRTPLPENWR